MHNGVVVVLALALACLSFACHGRRIQASIHLLQSNLPSCNQSGQQTVSATASLQTEGHKDWFSAKNAPAPWKALAGLLLGLHPVAAFNVVRGVLFGYAATLGLAAFAQRQLQYFPSPTRPQLPGIAEFEEHEILSADGTRCFLWHWPAPQHDVEPQPSYPSYLGSQAKDTLAAMAQLRKRNPQFAQIDVLQFHGNANDRSTRLPWMHLMREGLGCSVTVLDYRGYGGSDGSPTEKGLIMDGKAALAWLRGRQQTDIAEGSSSPVERRQVALYGQSIGSGVAVAVLDDETIGADGSPPADTSLVLEAGFSSCVDLGANAYPWLPVRLLMLDRFDSEGRARKTAARFGEKAGVPVLALHGELDEIAPLNFGQALYDTLPSRAKRLVVLPQTGHNDVPFTNPVRYLNEVAQFWSSELFGS